jgi:hypothetical protein
MRRIAIALVIALEAPAAADTGAYMTEAVGFAGFRGELSQFAAAPQATIGGGVRRDAISVELFGRWIVPDYFVIDCYGRECAEQAKPDAGIASIGLDVSHRWRLLYVRKWLGYRPGTYGRPGLFASVRGGPRWVWGTDAISGRDGPGLGAAASLEADVWIVGYFVDLGVDVYRLRGGGDTVHASSQFLMIGAKVGWL